MDKLGAQIENVEKRIKKIDADMKRLVEEALQKKKQKDTRGMIYNYNLTFSIRCFICLEEKEDVGKGSS